MTTVQSLYCWIPTEIQINEHGTAELLSRIHNLPQNVFTSGYLFKQGFKTTLQVPKIHFNIWMLTNNNQVVIKAQSYGIQPGMSYSGKWHVEGDLENIVAAGVYYCDIEPGITGGSLRFRPPHAPEYELG